MVRLILFQTFECPGVHHDGSHQCKLSRPSRGRLQSEFGLLQRGKTAGHVNGSKVVLAGSDQEGDSLTLHGTLDSTGSLMQATYILNGSASGRCETDDGTGNLSKR